MATHLKYMAGSSLIAMMLVTEPALAQTVPGTQPTEAAQPAEADPITQIIVTAQFRKQRLQDTPIAITALNSKMLNARGETSMLDIAASAPNVTIQQSNAGLGNAAVISIRGIGQSDSNFAMEPGVGVYIDDVYYPTIFGSVFDLLDLDRVEILRGPQGTLAGKNSIGGAIKLYTKKPDGKTGGMVEASYGSFSRIDLRAAANLVIVPDRLFMRISGAEKHSDGYLTRYDYGCLNPNSGIPANRITTDCKIGTQGGEDFQGVRAALRWLPSDKLEVNVVGDFSNDDPEPVASRLLYAANPFNRQFITTGGFENYATYSDPSKGYSVEPLSSAKSRGVSGTIDYTYADWLKLTSISAYRLTTGAFTDDSDLSPLGGTLSYVTQRFATLTQELRLTGAIAGGFNYVVGGYYFRGRGYLGGRNDVGTDIDATTHVTTVDFIQGDNINSSSKSVFGQLEFSPVNGLSASAGARYTDEKKTYFFRRIDPVTGGPAALVGGLNNVQATPYRNKRWDYRFNLNYRWAPELMTYATVSTGFKGGGVNPRPFTPAQAAPFLPETLTAYEIGAKSDLFDRRLRVDVSAFYNVYSDIQITTFGPYMDFPLSARPANAGKAHVKGLELEATAHPIDGLTIDGSVSYLNFKYVELSAGAIAAGINSGMVNAYTPGWKSSIGVQYAYDAGSVGTFTPRIDMNYQSSFYSQAQNAPTNLVDAYTVLNARLSYKPEDSRWEAALAVTNLANKYYYVNKFDNSTQPVGDVVGTVARPREWMVSFKRTF